MTIIDAAQELQKQAFPALSGLQTEAASPVRLVRPRPDHFSAGRWSRSQTAEIV